MHKLNINPKLIAAVERELGVKVVGIKIPPQGMTSQVFFVETNDNQEFAVKYGADALKDIPAFKLISEHKISVPVPKLIKSFDFEDAAVIILEKVRYPLLETVSANQIAQYIPSMVSNLKKMHAITSAKPSLLAEPEKPVKSWKDMLLSIFDGREFNWEEIASREGLDRELILNSVNQIVDKIGRANVPESNFSFLHTDFNQRNLFVDPETDQIAGIIDWGEAMYGDPIYDFARIRMYIWHFGLGDDVVNDYYRLLSYSQQQKELEDLYWLFRVIQYLAWYSEELNEFNTCRIKLHQDFLRKYNW